MLNSPFSNPSPLDNPDDFQFVAVKGLLHLTEGLSPCECGKAAICRRFSAFVPCLSVF